MSIIKYEKFKCAVCGAEDSFLVVRSTVMIGHPDIDGG